MDQSIKITELPTKERAHLRATILRQERPGWRVRYVEQPGGAFAVIGTPPGQKPAMLRNSISVKESVAAHPEATLERAGPLLKLIRTAESGGNYEAHFGKSGNSGPRFCQMSIKSVLDWQKSFLSGGGVYSGVGAYQISRGTLKEIIRRPHLDLAGNETFDAHLQDQMAFFLLRRRGLEEYLVGSLDIAGFVNEIAKEWACLPKMDGEGHYDCSGAAMTLIELSDVRTVVELISIQSLKNKQS